MIELWGLISNVIKVAGPAIIGLASLLITYGLIKMFLRTKDAMKEIFSNPLGFVFFVIIAALGIWLFFKHIVPLL